jgi:toxin-antitoxin system PIN domain toxin
MSYSVDANVLLYASDGDSPWHEPARDFLAAVPQRPEILCLAWPTLMAYLRLATHPSIFVSPLTPAQATANLDALVRLPRVRLLGEGKTFWESYLRLTSDQPVRGNLVPDAHLAVLLHAHGVRALYTRDRDFRKFAFLEIRDPFAPGGD